MTKILYLKTQNVPHTPQNDDETKSVANKINSYTPHTKAIILLGGSKQTQLTCMGGCYLRCGAYSAPKELCTPKFSQFWGTLMQQPMWPHIYDTRTNMAMMWCYVAHMWHLEMHWECIMTCEICCEHIIMTNGHHHIGLKMCMQLI